MKSVALPARSLGPGPINGTAAFGGVGAYDGYQAKAEYHQPRGGSQLNRMDGAGGTRERSESQKAGPDQVPASVSNQRMDCRRAIRSSFRQ